MDRPQEPLDALQSLHAVEAACWAEMANAAASRGHAWRTMTLATTDGREAFARSVILREVDAEARELLFFTDSRSTKVRHIAEHPRGTLLLWSAQLGWQLRLRVTLEVETAGLAVSSRWAQLKLTPAAQDYLSPAAPGTPLCPPSPERASRGHFALVHAHVRALDWLELQPEGQRRACFDALGGKWLQP
ncbi:pyridoxamine 5'-phosphate oxidase family protein [Azohydromonas lata]|uniref:Pyridoxamine 5'-phosphate oxidase family protein n=1 Tax=Azohydromonas lata TaxID=45677 RepID=A0ABU5ICG2_9BURK|nr:pyridoxamine 5'-phosphate oxidase family protein [Azohydromonas lata]MDZ5456504.1 pyridoxamine 5'-phosphate oxidase family protein [Azohydromonas lata]